MDIFDEMLNNVMYVYDHIDVDNFTNEFKVI